MGSDMKPDLIRRVALVFFVCASLISFSARPVLAHQPHDPVKLVALSPDFQSDGTLFVVLDEWNILFKSTDRGRTFYPPTDRLSSEYPITGGLIWSALNTGAPAMPVSDIAI